MTLHDLCARRLAAGVWLLLLLGVTACIQPPPDVGATTPIRDEDTRIVVLLREVDHVADTDGREAARLIRETVLPRAQANARAAAALSPRHPRARRLDDRLAALTAERADMLVAYATALDTGDIAAQLAAVRRQRRLEEDLLRLETQIDSAARAPSTRGCSSVPGAS